MQNFLSKVASSDKALLAELDSGKRARQRAAVDPLLCSSCMSKEPKYKCPCCEVRSCSLTCVKQHKADRNCEGKRPRSSFLRVKEMNDNTLVQDFTFLQDTQAAVQGLSSRDPLVKGGNRSKHNKYASPKHKELLKQCSRRSPPIGLLLMPQGMQRHAANSTVYRRKLKHIAWRVDWVFVANARRTVTTMHFPEYVSWGEVLHDLLLEHPRYPSAAQTSRTVGVGPMGPAESVAGAGEISGGGLVQAVQAPRKPFRDTSKQRQRSAGILRHDLRKHAELIDELKLFMRCTNSPANKPRFYPVPISSTPQTFLAGKSVIEYPTILVALPEEAGGYALVECEIDVQSQGGRAGQQEEEKSDRSLDISSAAAGQNSAKESSSIEREVATPKNGDAARAVAPGGSSSSAGSQANTDAEPRPQTSVDERSGTTSSLSHNTVVTCSLSLDEF